MLRPVDRKCDVKLQLYLLVSPELSSLMETQVEMMGFLAWHT
jgi:hypothetical protein